MKRALVKTMQKGNSLIKMTVLSCGLAGVAFAQHNTLRAFDVKSRQDGVDVHLTCSEVPKFHAFRLREPDRLVVDVTQGKVHDIQGHHKGAGPVRGIVITQFQNNKTYVGRLLFGLSHARTYAVRVEGRQLIISVESNAATTAPAHVSKTAQQGKGTTLSKARPDAAAVQGAVDGETVVSSRVHEKAVKHPAQRLQRLHVKRDGLRLYTDGALARFDVLELVNPPRLALDLMGLRGVPKVPRRRPGNVRALRIGAHADKVRVVLELERPVPFQVRRRADGLELWLQTTTPKAAETTGQPVATELAKITNVRFLKSKEGMGRVELTLQGKPRVTVGRPDARSAVLNLPATRLPKSLEKSFDTSAFKTPVKMVSIFSVPGKLPRVRLVAAGAHAFEQVVTQERGKLIWRFSREGFAEGTKKVRQTAGVSTRLVHAASVGAARRRYVGKRVSFEFKDIEIHNLLRIFGEVSKKNIVVADDVSGKVTIRLRNVPWDEALNIILRSKNLGKEEFGNIIRIAPLQTLEAEAKSRAARKKSRRLQRDLEVALIPVNYSRADDMNSRVKEILSERGNTSIDKRTNTLIVRDLPENMAKVRSLVSSLDLQTPQVLIESRIIEASTRYAREIGVQWGGHGLMAASTGNPTGLIFPSSVSLLGGVPSTTSSGTNTVPNYAVSLPVGAGEGSGGALGLTLGSAGGAVQLNLRLSALEAEGSIKTISAPRVTTLDNATARISQGVSIPFSQVSAAGTNTQFIEARLSLEVTPHITRDGSVLMDIRAENNQPDPANTGANGQPGISRKEAQTNVLVRNGETTVIGGIYVRSGSSNSAGLPLLSKIPVLGFFFRNNRELETKNELLVFITPRILNRFAMAKNP